MNDSEGCRALVEHLHHEHHRLKTLLLEIGHEIAAVHQAKQGAGFPAQLAQRLADLRKELQLHFAEEEAGGCLEEAVTKVPSLANESKAILAEHAVLDGMLEQLVAQTRDPLVGTADIVSRYRTFTDKLETHDMAENRILQMAFGAEAADYDVEGVG